MRQLYQIACGAATYWVVAETWEKALHIVAADESCEEEPHLDYPLDQKTASRIPFKLDGEEESCSMWFAYLIMRDYGSGILATTEW